MKTKFENRLPNELDNLCSVIRSLVNERNYDACIPVICRAMEIYPHAPQPHNLLGIVLEKKGDHLGAMKHFRAAWALDSTYLPATYNLKTYGTFFSSGSCAFDEGDVPAPSPSKIEIVYDERGIGHMVNRIKVIYDEHGIGHVVRR